MQEYGMDTKFSSKIKMFYFGKSWKTEKQIQSKMRSIIRQEAEKENSNPKTKACFQIDTFLVINDNLSSNQYFENFSESRSKSRDGRYKRVITVDSSSDEEIEINGVTTQDREPETEKKKRVAEQSKNKRVKISTRNTTTTDKRDYRLVTTTEKTKIPKRVNTAEPIKRSTGPTCWCRVSKDLCKIHEAK